MGIWTRYTGDVTFCLIVDDVGIKYTNCCDAKHLLVALQALYVVTTDWTGSLYIAVKIDWDYHNKTVDISMPGYINKALNRFQHKTFGRSQHSPHAWTKPQYGSHPQLTPTPDNTDLLPPSTIMRIQEVVGALLFYVRAIDSTMLVSLSTIASQQFKGTQATAKALTRLLNYAAAHPDATVRYHASDMYLHVQSDASYLSEASARSRASGTFFLVKRPTDPSKPQAPTAIPPPQNGAIHLISTIMRNFMASAMEAELGALFHNARDGIPLRTTLIEMGHDQESKPIRTENACAAGVANENLKQRRSKAIDMRFYGIRDRIKQGQFIIHWRKGTDDLTDYFTKHHSPAHHKHIRSNYLFELHKPAPAELHKSVPPQFCMRVC
jgi:hypothetical protein